MSATPTSSWPWVKTVLQTVFDQPATESVHAQFDRVLAALEHKLPKSFEHLEAAREEILAFTVFPKRSRCSRKRSGSRSGPTTPPNG
jgi:putative transposase